MGLWRCCVTMEHRAFCVPFGVMRPRPGDGTAAEGCRSKGLNRLGYDLRRLTGVEPDPMPYLLQSACSVYAIDLVIDRRGRCGQWGASLREAGYRGVIVSFEPVRSARTALAETAALHMGMGWKVRGEALGELTRPAYR